MPLSYEIDVDARLVVLTVGNTSLERWRKTMFDVFADPRYQPGFSTLVDCRTATLVPSTGDVHGVVEFLRDHRVMLGRARWAVVVDRQGGYGMARMASTIAEFEGIELAAFQSVDEALGWLSSGPVEGDG